MRDILNYYLPSDPIPASTLWVQAFLSALTTWGMSFFTWYTSDLPVSILILTISMGVDYATGFLAAHMNKAWDRTKGTDGLLKKAVVLITLISLHYVVKLAGGPPWIADVVIYLFNWNEWKSSIANLRRGKVEVPVEADEILNSVRVKLISLLRVEATAIAAEKAESTKGSSAPPAEPQK